jgi:hypothetical protein
MIIPVDAHSAAGFEVALSKKDQRENSITAITTVEESRALKNPRGLKALLKPRRITNPTEQIATKSS